MGTVADKLSKLLSTKADIKAAIIEKGQAVAEADAFSSYADKIRGISSGIDTTDATAAAADIISGKTAYAGGQKITGSMPTVEQAVPEISVSSNGLVTASAAQEAGYVAGGTKTATKQLTTQPGRVITPGTGDKTAVPAKRFTVAAVTVAGDANLVSSNIKSGVSIFGVAGSYSNGLSTMNVSVYCDNITNVNVYYTGSNGYINQINVSQNNSVSLTCASYSPIIFVLPGTLEPYNVSSGLSQYAFITSSNPNSYSTMNNGYRVLQIRLYSVQSSGASIRF